MLESHGNISILLSDVHDLLLYDSPLNFTDLVLNTCQTDTIAQGTITLTKIYLIFAEMFVVGHFKPTNMCFCMITLTIK